MQTQFTDPTDACIAAILAEIDVLKAAALQFNVTAASIVQTATSIGAELTLPPGTRPQLWSSIAALNYSAGSRTQDVELLARESKLNQYIGGVPLSPISITTPISATLTPDKPSIIKWQNGVGSRWPFRDTFLIVTHWNLAVENQNPIELLIVLPSTLVVDSTATIGAQLVGCPTMMLEDGTSYDPFQKIPIAQRRDIRQHAINTITSDLSNFTFALPVIPSMLWQSILHRIRLESVRS